MRKFWLFLLITMCTWPAWSEQADHKWGVGLMIGSIDSVNGKYWLSKNSAIDFGLGFGPIPAFVYADYMWHFWGLFGSSTQFGRETSAYIAGGGGAGGVVLVRAQFGIEWTPVRKPFAAFAELGPAFVSSNNGSSGAGIDVEIGGRFLF